MKRHVFLTGKKRVGKSTLLKKAVSAYGGTIGGFFTVRTNALLGDEYSVHMFEVGNEPAASCDNLLFICGRENPDKEERFNFLGIKAVNKNPGAELIIMDELGPNESKAEPFRKTVIKLLDEKPHILGVLQAPAEKFWPDITCREDVLLINVTEENRDSYELINEIKSIIF